MRPVTTRASNALVGSLLFAIVLAIALAARTAYHPWGDDWAAYLLQARALVAGDALGELTRNARLLALGDGAYPSAAPWGFPALLASVGATVGWGFASLKLVGVVSLALTAVFAFAIARFYLPVAMSALVALTLTLSSGVLDQADVLGSDLPFLACSIVTLFLIERSMRGPDTRWPRAAVMAAIAALASAAFTIRTNGIFLFPCAGVGVAMRWYHTRSRAQLVTDAVVLVAIAMLCTGAYFLALPDGSHTQSSFILLEPRSVVRRAVETALSAREFAPFAWWPSSPVGFVGLGLTGLVVAGALARGLWLGRPYSLMQLAWGALNFGLLAVFRYNGGIRYFFPLLLPLYLFAALGVYHLVARRGASGPSRRTQVFAVMALAAWTAILFGGAIRVVRSDRPYRQDGPHTVQTAELVTFLKRNTPPAARISFYKPRGLRSLTDRDVTFISRPEWARRVDYLVLTRHPERLRWEVFPQIDPAQVQDVGLDPVFTNDDFVVYRVLR